MRGNLRILAGILIALVALAGGAVGLSASVNGNGTARADADVQPPATPSADTSALDEVRGKLPDVSGTLSGTTSLGVDTDHGGLGAVGGADASLSDEGASVSGGGAAEGSTPGGDLAVSESRSISAP